MNFQPQSSARKMTYYWTIRFKRTQTVRLNKEELPFKGYICNNLYPHSYNQYIVNL